MVQIPTNDFDANISRNLLYFKGLPVFGNTLIVPVRYGDYIKNLLSSLPIILMVTMMMMTIPITITITTTAQDCRMLKGITMMIIVLLMKACIESSRDISFVFLPLSAWITTEGIYNNINNNYYFTYIYVYIITGSFDRRWSRFFYVKFYLHNNNNKYMIIPRFMMERRGFSPIFFISGSAAAIERGGLCSCAIDYESGGICRCISC